MISQPPVHKSKALSKQYDKLSNIYGPHQLAVFKELTSYINKHKTSRNILSRFITLNGSAGTGKTALIIALLSEYATCVASATTHQAVAVLQGRLNKCMCTYPSTSVKTIHSILGLKISKNSSENKVSLVKSRSSGYLGNIGLLIIDESSMLSMDVVDHLIARLKTHSQILVLFVRDKYQIPSVANSAEEFINSTHQITLEEPIRQKTTNTIIPLCNSIINIIKGSPVKLKLAAYEPNVKVLGKEDFLATMRKHCPKPTATTKADTLVVAWRNARVTEIGNYLHKHWGYHRYNNAVYIPPVGALISVSSYDNIGTCTATVQPTHNKVKSYINTELKIPIHTTTICNITGNPHTVSSNTSCDIFTVADTAAFDTHLQALAVKARKERYWGHYYSAIDSVSKIGNPYVSTVHKSQGSTVDNVFIDLSDILENHDLNMVSRLLYVAVSRARHNVYIYRG